MPAPPAMKGWSTETMDSVHLVAINGLGADRAAADGAPRSGTDEIEALDAYSRAVAGAVERLGPSVVSLAVARPAPERFRRRGLRELRGGGRSEEHTSELQSR